MQGENESLVRMLPVKDVLVDERFHDRIEYPFRVRIAVLVTDLMLGGWGSARGVRAAGFRVLNLSKHRMRHPSARKD